MKNILILFIFTSLPSWAGWDAYSPDGNLSFQANLNKNGTLLISASGFETQFLRHTEASLQIKDSPSPLRFLKAESFTRNEAFDLPTGKKRHHEIHYNELLIHFEKNSILLTLTARVSNEGVAWRWETQSRDSIQITSENASFLLPPNSTTWAMDYWDQDYSYETQYKKENLSSLPGKRKALPLLAKTPEAQWILLFEAAPEPDYSGSHLIAKKNGALSLEWDLSDRKKGFLSVPPSFKTPWRGAIFSKNLATLVESDWPVALSPETENLDFSWVKPGLSSWSWYSGMRVDSLEKSKDFVDLAADFGWKYYLADLGWQESWMPELIRYAETKGVGIILWEEYKKVASQKDLESTFAKWSNWGVKGVKIDFFNSERQEIQTLYDRILRSAAHHCLVVNFHGADTKIITLQRKWPNLITAEAVYGEEQRIWNTPPDSAHFNTIFPFTRNVLGSMDSTLLPYFWHGKETLGHLTALSVIFESGIGHLADTYVHYATSPVRPFLSKLPTAWDETRLLSGEPEDHVVIARRNGTDWFVGGISTFKKDFNLPLSFLGSNWKGFVQVYSDLKPDLMEMKELKIHSTLVPSLTLPVLDRGGFVLRFSSRPLSEETPFAPLRTRLIQDEMYFFSQYLKSGRPQ